MRAQDLSLLVLPVVSSSSHSSVGQLQVKTLFHETTTMLHFYGNIAADPCSCFDTATGGAFGVFSVVTKFNNSKQIKPEPKIRLSRRLRKGQNHGDGY